MCQFLAYMSILANVKQFQDLNALSLNYFSSVTVADFEANSACWHKSCQKKFQQYQARKGKKKKKYLPCHRNERENTLSDRK